MSRNAKDLNISRTEALHGLLRSIGHVDDNSPSSGATLSTEQVQKLSEKINEILGDGEGYSLKPGDQPSQDGLPIIDISEPVDEDLQTSTSSPPAPEHDLIPLSLLPAEREWRRRERDRMLDSLEEEERLQQLQEERDAEEDRREAIRKRKESTLYQLRAARELQKKMGQALVRHAKGTQESGEEDARSKPQTASSTSKKSVSFADAPIVEANKSDQQTPIRQPDLGDVALGRLRAQNRVPLVSTAEAQKYPMKMRVVERRPVATPTSSSHSDADSDDESTSSAAHLSLRLENDSSGEEDKSLSSNDALSDDTPLEEGFDYDMAQHQREIVLEYHKKRHAVGAETAKVMAAHIPDNDDQQEILQSKGQTPLSRFRADRMAAVYDKSHGSISTSIGQHVIPASRQKSLQTSVKLGKLENGQLVGEESGESGSEDEAAREVFEMLRTGNVQNVGPEFNPSSISSITPPRNPDIVGPQPTGTSTIAKPSKFKLARGGGIAEMTTFEDSINRDNVQSHPAISNVVERKAPRSSPRQHFPVNRPPPRSRVKTSEQPPPTIVDSPSFPMMPTPSSSPVHPVTTGSPSLHQTRLQHPPSVDADSSVTQESTIRSRTPTRNSLSVERPISKFMAETNKLTE